MKRCSKCQADKPRSEFGNNRRTRDGLHSHCRECRRAYTAAEPKERQRERNRRHYRRHPDRFALRMAAYRAANAAKIAARNAVRTAIRNGTMKKQPCEVCGAATGTEAHHASYEPDRRLDVRWLCGVHHAAVHQNEEL